MQALLDYHYPGNVRELKNIIERLVVLAEHGVVTANDLPELRQPFHKQIWQEPIQPLREIRRKFETEYIQKVVEQCEYNLTEAAKKLDISRRQLFNKMREYGLR